jgi:hypothetical protein
MDLIYQPMRYSVPLVAALARCLTNVKSFYLSFPDTLLQQHSWTSAKIYLQTLAISPFYFVHVH